LIAGYIFVAADGDSDGATDALDSSPAVDTADTASDPGAVATNESSSADFCRYAIPYTWHSLLPP